MIMNCKFCQAELAPNSSVCPECGKDNLKDGLKGLKITALVLACALMLTVLVGLVIYGISGNFLGIGSSNSVTYQISTSEGIVTVNDKDLEKHMDTVVVTMGEHEMTNRELQLYYWMSAMNYGENADLTQPLNEQIYDEETGKTYEEYFLELAVEAWQEVTLMSAAAKEAGYELPQDYKDYLESIEETLEGYVEYYQYYGYPVEDVDDYIQLQFGPGCDFETYYNYSYDYYMGGLYWTEMMTNLTVTDQELEEYFTENETVLKEDYAIPVTKDYGDLVDLRVITVATVKDEVKDEDGNVTSSTENWETTLEKVEELYDQYVNGVKTEESFIELVKKNSADTNTAADGGMYSDLYAGCLMEVDVRHILIQPEGGEEDENCNTVYTEEAWADAYAEAESILNMWLEGEMTASSFGSLANEYSDDNNGYVTNGGLYVDVYMGQMVKEFEEWCFDKSRQEGDYGIVKTQYGYHIMYFVHADRNADDWAFNENRQVGDVTYMKTDSCYMILYYSGSEAAWSRYCRYGVQSKKAADLLDQMIEENVYTVDNSKVALAQPE